MKYLILSILTFISLAAFAQTEIKIEDVDNHTGDSVKIMARFIEESILNQPKAPLLF
jgi:hypothetical protein